MAKLANRVKMNCTTVGTGDATLTTAVTSFLTPAQAGIADGDWVDYGFEDGNNSEQGIAQIVGGGLTLQKRTVQTSTNSNALISLSGAATVLLSPTHQTLNPLAAFLHANAGGI